MAIYTTMKKYIDMLLKPIISFTKFLKSLRNTHMLIVSALLLSVLKNASNGARDSDEVALTKGENFSYTSNQRLQCM